MKRLERRINLGFGAALLVLTLVTAAAWWNVARFTGTHYWVQHTRDVLSELEAARSAILGMQSSARGFVLTGSEEMLGPFQRGSVRLTQSLAELQQLVADNPGQQERLTQLEPLAAHAREIMTARIDARRARGLAAAGEVESYLEGQRSVDAFGEVVRAMVAEERHLLDDRLRGAHRFGQLTVFTIVGASALATGFVLAAARIVRGDLRRRQKAELAQQESFARIEDLYNRAPCGYHSLDASGTFVAINDTALQWLGYTRPEVVGRMNYVEILPPDSRAVFQEQFRRFKERGSIAGVEYDWRRKDGTMFPVLLNATAIYDGNGNYLASRATVFDATDRKRAEAERDRFFTLSRDLLCVAGNDGYFKRINPSWEQSLGFAHDELMARPFIEWVHPDDVERTRAAFERLSAGQEMIAFETRFRCKDGSFRWFSWNARQAPLENRIYASAHDVTEQRAAAERIHKLNSDLAARATQLEMANGELESFSYSVSHDLRAPLRHIDGFASLLAKRTEASIDAESRRYITTISNAAKKMGLLIDDLLAFSRIGRMTLHLETVNQDQLVAEVIANGRYEHSPGPPVAWEVGRLLPARADPAMLRQVWVNLIDNAVKYSSKSPAPRIAIGAREDPIAGEQVFFVRDNGVGFDMAYADKLFGVFQRLHGASEFDGTGIGLANVRRIVTRHGGRTWAESQVGQGATFYFSLPHIVPDSGSSS